MFDKEAIEALQEGEAISSAATSIIWAVAETAATTSRGLAALPKDYAVHDLEAHLPKRRRARGSMTTEHLASFADYTHAHAEPGATVLVDTDSMTAHAVLNMGVPTAPGHADNVANLLSKPTAAFLALKNVTARAVKQGELAEWLEDWVIHVQCLNDDGPMNHGTAMQAVRNLTIEAMRKLESTEEQLSASVSSFESVKASSKNQLPTLIYFDCEPYHGFAKRTFVLRLAVLTSEAKPTMSLRVIRMEEHTQEMAAELAARVTDAISAPTVAAQPVVIPVLIGKYRVAA